MALQEEPRRIGGKLNQAIAGAVVRAHREYLGRGPTRAQAFYRHNVVVVILGDGLTTAERNLVAADREDAVAHLRQELQSGMRDLMVGAVEELTGRRVEAFLSAQSLEPDVASEVFVLDGPIGDGSEADDDELS